MDFDSSAPDQTLPTPTAASRARFIPLALLYVAAHLLLEWLSTSFDKQVGISIWYPAAGLIFAIIIYFGAAGALLAICTIIISHLISGDPRIPISYIIPYAMTITTMVLLLRLIAVRLGILRQQLVQSPKWAVGLMALATLTALSNTLFGGILLYVTTILSKQDIVQSALTFFLGDLVGIFSLAPLLTLALIPEIMRAINRKPIRLAWWIKLTVIYSIIGAIGYGLLALGGEKYKIPIIYFGAIPILFSAVHGRVRETCLVIFILTLFLSQALTGTDTTRYLDLSVFILMVMAIAYVVTTAVSTNRSVMLSLQATLDQRDLLAAEREKLSSQVQHLRSMEALGTLAGGMAHELNNLLQPILTFSQAAETASENDRKYYLGRAKECILSARSLVQDVLIFARGGIEANATDLSQTAQADMLIRSSFEIARKNLPATMVVKERYDAGTARMACVPSQLVQILINLLRNAADAQARTIAISTSHDMPAGRIVLTVTDDGLGMDKETCDRALEPFFSTKTIGRGTGLGLSVTYGLIQKWGGDLHIDSASGRGTSIILHFPVQQQSEGHIDGDHIAG
jgi:signal transduction histidine kinase